MEIRVLFFASARESAGTSQETIDVDDGCNSTDFRHVLAQKYPSLAETVLNETAITFAVNEEYVQSGQVVTLKNNDTVALIPPISGG